MLATSFLKCFVFCGVLLKCVSASINVKVDAILRKADTVGSDVAIISDDERIAYEIDDYNLKSALRVAFGKRPDDVFVRSPTPWGDLYKTYSWKEIHRTLQPTSTKILSSSMELVTLNSKTFENYLHLPVEYQTNMFKEESCIVTHTWNKSPIFNSGIKLSYSINFPIAFFEASVSMTYKNNWGNSKTIRQPVRIGTMSGVKILLPPRTKATLTLVAKKVNMEVQINYETTLEGQTALNYGIPFKGHHFWGYRLESIFAKNNKSLSFSSSENLHLSYYTEPKIMLENRETKHNILNITTVLDVVEEFLILKP